MKSDSTTVIKNMEFLVKELHKEWDRSGAAKASVIISLDEVEAINEKVKGKFLIFSGSCFYTSLLGRGRVNCSDKEQPK